MYTVSQTAAALNVSPPTIRNWVAEFADYLSEQAAPGPGIERRITEDDLDILQTVAILRGQAQGYDDIRSALADGIRLELPEEAQAEQDAPQEAKRSAKASAPADVASSALVAFQQTLQAYQEQAERAEAKIDALQDARAKAEAEAAALRAELDALKRRPITMRDWLRGHLPE
jgi:chromosome segregation ATPase